jgi:hypothetical protein
MLQKVNQHILVCCAACFLLLSLLMTMACSESGVTIKGNIQKSKEYKLNGAKLLLVPIDAQKMEIKKANILYDIEDKVLGVDYVSDMPATELKGPGPFVIKLASLKPGHYLLGVQSMGLINKPAGHFGPGPLISRPLAVAEGTHIVLVISEQDKPSFTIDVGDVIIPVDKADLMITAKVKKVKKISP